MSLLGIAASVVMVGHSLFGPDGPDMLQAALRAGTGEGTVRAQIINGAPLKYNWDRSDTAEGIDARALLPEGATTHLILTEAIPLANHVNWSETSFYAQAFAGLAAAANPDVRIYVQETWHSLQSGTGVAVQYDDGAQVPWRQRLDQDLPIWQNIVSQLTEGIRSDRATVELIPAGQAMARLFDEITSQSVPGLTDISTLFADDIHLNDTGHYFVAMVQYATLTGQSPVGLPTDFNDRWGRAFDTPDADLARVLQRVAFEAVQAYGIQVANPHAPDLPSGGGVVPSSFTGPPELPKNPAPDLVANAQGLVAGTNAVAMGLASVSDRSPQAPFIDLMKTARPWVGHEPGKYGGMTYDELRKGGYLDANGWPIRMPKTLRSIGTLILTDMPETATSLKGRYRLGYRGKGVVEVSGRAENVRYGKGEVTFDYEPGPGSVEIRVQRINTSDPPRDIAVVRLENAKRHAGGALFNPLWTARVGPFQALRFTRWMQVDNSELSNWADRPKLEDVTWAGGVPVEVMVQLANELEVDIWVNMPHLADDDFVRQFATLVRDSLDPSLKVYVEFSNAVWDGQLEQARWADQQARARWNAQNTALQYYGLRAAEVAQIWSAVFEGDAAARLVNVISGQTAELGQGSEILTAPLAQAEGLPAPVQAFDAYAIAGHFGDALGRPEQARMLRSWLAESRMRAEAAALSANLSATAADQYIEQNQYEHARALAARELLDGAISGNLSGTLSDLIGRIWPFHAQMAQAHGVDLILYAGGPQTIADGAQHVDPALFAFLLHFDYSAEMGALTATQLKGWKALGGQLFTADLEDYPPDMRGGRGMLRHLEDTNPRWDALVAFE